MMEVYNRIILRDVYYGITPHICIYMHIYTLLQILRQIYYSRYIMADIVRLIYHSRCITADILQQIHYGRNIAYHKNLHTSTCFQRQKRSIAACESVCCNASPQRVRGPPRQPWDALGCLGNPPGHFVTYTRKQCMSSYGPGGGTAS